MRYIAVALLAAVVIIAGCTSGTVQPGVSLTMRADPSPVFTNSFTTISVDIDNRDVKSVSNVDIQVFDTGTLRGQPCEKQFTGLLPNEFQSISCVFLAPNLQVPDRTEVNAMASFDSQLSFTNTFEVMTENEYQRRVAGGAFVSRPEKYSYKDSNVMVDVEFSEPPPLILAPEKKYFVYFTVTNIGNGFVKEIDDGELKQYSEGILECPPFGTIYPTGKTFPRIACEIIVPSGFMQGKEFRSTDIGADFLYRYEIRKSLGINIIK